MSPDRNAPASVQADARSALMMLEHAFRNIDPSAARDVEFKDVVEHFTAHRELVLNDAIDCVRAYSETLVPDLRGVTRWIELALIDLRNDAQGMSAREGQDPQGLGATPASPVPQGCAPTTPEGANP